MRKLALFISVVTLGSFHFAHAERPAELPACAAMAKSCEAAGFMPGAHKKDGKGLWVDCVGAIAHGKTVQGVSGSQSDAKACIEASKAMRKSKKGA